MTKMMEHVLNLPHLEDILKEVEQAETADPSAALEDHQADEPSSEETEQANAEALAAMNHALATMQAKTDLLDGSDHAQSLEDIYKETLKHSQDLMDLGFNVDIRSARGIFEVAASMFKNAIDAKNAKRELQLKTLKMSLDERKIRLAEKEFDAQHGGNVIDDANVITIDRNELLRQATAKAKKI